MDKNTERLIDKFMDMLDYSYEYKTSTERLNIERKLTNIAKSAMRNKVSEAEKKSKEIKNEFMIYFDGIYGVNPNPNVSSTISMGVCKLEYNEDLNKLTVHLRRPGLLIGKGGRTVSALGKHLDCEIDIVEVNLLKD